MSRLMILDESVLIYLSSGKQTNSCENPSHVTAFGVGN